MPVDTQWRGHVTSPDPAAPRPCGDARPGTAPRSAPPAPVTSHGTTAWARRALTTEPDARPAGLGEDLLARTGGWVPETRAVGGRPTRRSLCRLPLRPGAAAGSQTGPQGLSTRSADGSVVAAGERGHAPDICWAEARDTAQHPTGRWTPHDSHEPHTSMWGLGRP